MNDPAQNSAFLGRGWSFPPTFDRFTRGVELVQGERVLWQGRLKRVMPGRSAALPAAWTRGVDFDAGPVVCHLREPG